MLPPANLTPKLASAGLTHSNDLANPFLARRQRAITIDDGAFRLKAERNAKFCLRGSREARFGSVECCTNRTGCGA
jgi:hypothetical protein